MMLVYRLLGHEPHHLAGGETFCRWHRFGEPIAPVCQRRGMFHAHCFGGDQLVERPGRAFMRALKKSQFLGIAFVHCRSSLGVVDLANELDRSADIEKQSDEENLHWNALVLCII